MQSRCLNALAQLGPQNQNWEWRRQSRWWVEFLSREGGRHCFILASDKNKKDQKILRSKLVHYCPNLDYHKQRTLKYRKKPDRSRATNHKSQNLTFCTRTNKRVFPKRFARMIDGTEKPRIPSTSAKCAARYNEFGSKPMQWRFVPLPEPAGVYIQSHIQGFVGITTPVISCKTGSSSTWLQTILKHFHFKVTKLVVVLDDEAASFTNDSVVHVEFVPADINGWNVLRKTVEQVIGTVWSLIFFLVGGGRERCCCFSLSFFFVLFGFDLITTLINISIISQHSPFKIKRPRAIQKNSHCSLQEHC